MIGLLQLDYTCIFAFHFGHSLASESRKGTRQDSGFSGKLYVCPAVCPGGQ